MFLGFVFLGFVFRGFVFRGGVRRKSCGHPSSPSTGDIDEEEERRSGSRSTDRDERSMRVVRGKGRSEGRKVPKAWGACHRSEADPARACHRRSERRRPLAPRPGRWTTRRDRCGQYARGRSGARSGARSSQALSRERSDAGESGFERKREARWGKVQSTTCGDRRRRDRGALQRSPRVLPPSPASRTAFARRPLPLVAWRLAGEALRLPVSPTRGVATRGRGGIAIRGREGMSQGPRASRPHRGRDQT